MIWEIKINNYLGKKQKELEQPNIKAILYDLVPILFAKPKNTPIVELASIITDVLFEHFVCFVDYNETIQLLKSCGQTVDLIKLIVKLQQISLSNKKKYDRH